MDRAIGRKTWGILPERADAGGHWCCEEGRSRYLDAGVTADSHCFAPLLLEFLCLLLEYGDVVYCSFACFGELSMRNCCLCNGREIVSAGEVAKIVQERSDTFGWRWDVCRGARLV